MYSITIFLQSFCCVDKKGILSWPNPTAEKVFFMRTDSTQSDIESSFTSESEMSDDDDSGSEHPSVAEEKQKQRTCSKKGII